MDTTTSIITMVTSVCILVFGTVAVAASLYGILVWYPRYRKQKVDRLKEAGIQGEATIIGLPKHKLGLQPGRSSVFTMVPIA